MENKSENKIYAKLLEFQKKINAIKKDGKNPHFKSTYATLSQILSEVKPVLNECNLVILQLIDENGVGTVIVDPDNGGRIASYIPMPLGLNAQQLGSAITYFRRYTCASLLSLEIDDDDATGAVKPANKAKCLDTAFTSAVERIKKGEKDIINKLIATFDLTQMQLDILQDYK